MLDSAEVMGCEGIVYNTKALDNGQILIMYKYHGYDDYNWWTHPDALELVCESPIYQKLMEVIR